MSVPMANGFTMQAVTTRPRGQATNQGVCRTALARRPDRRASGWKRTATIEQAASQSVYRTDSSISDSEQEGWRSILRARNMQGAWRARFVRIRLVCTRMLATKMGDEDKRQTPLAVEDVP